MGKKWGKQLKGFVTKAAKDIARETSKGADQLGGFFDKAETQLNDGTFAGFLHKAVDQAFGSESEQPVASAAEVSQPIIPASAPDDVAPLVDVQQPKEVLVVVGDAPVVPAEQPQEATQLDLLVADVPVPAAPQPAIQAPVLTVPNFSYREAPLIAGDGISSMSELVKTLNGPFSFTHSIALSTVISRLIDKVSGCPVDVVHKAMCRELYNALEVTYGEGFKDFFQETLKLRATSKPYFNSDYLTGFVTEIMVPHNSVDDHQVVVTGADGGGGAA